MIIIKKVNILDVNINRIECLDKPVEINYDSGEITGSTIEEEYIKLLPYKLNRKHL
jgi:hypothetical protein